MNELCARVELDLTAIRGVVSDMDGVLWRGNDILPGAVDFFALLRRQGIPFVLAGKSGLRAEWNQDCRKKRSCLIHAFRKQKP